MISTGILYIVATPIGNLEDISQRAINILKNDVDVIFCEDTRQTRKLLNNYNISKKTQSFHSHSAERTLDNAVQILKTGSNIAYVSDCGTPAISDPGSRLVDAAHKNKIKVSPIPGPSALTAIVSVSGFNGKNVIFTGFLTKKPGRRINELNELKKFKGTIVIYESPHRILKTLVAINEVFEDNQIIIAREITKIYEEIIRTKCDCLEEIISNLTVKGEFCIAINNN